MNLKNAFMIIILLLVLWNIYTGATVQEVGIPGVFSIKFGKTEKVKMRPLERDTNYQGNDISNFEVTNPEECQQLCEKDERCKVMTFVQYRSNQLGGKCWLKSDVGVNSPSPGMVSSVKVYGAK